MADPEDLKTATQETDAPEDQQDSARDEVQSDDPLSGVNEDLQNELYQLMLKCYGEDRYARLVEVKDCKKRRLYWRGLQYLWWSERKQNWALPSAAQSPLGGDSEELEDMPRFEFVTNIFQAFGLSIAAALAQAPPRIRFFPEDAEDPKDLETADGYSRLIKIIERWNPTQKVMQDEAYYLWTDGVIGSFAHYEEDEERFGSSEKDSIEASEEVGLDEVRCAECGFSAPATHFVPPMPCPTCGNPLTQDNVAPGQSTAVPVAGSPEKVPNGREVITIVGALNLKRPQWANEQSQFHYLAYEDEQHYAKLRRMHPEVADRIKPGASLGSDEAFERNARLSVAEGTRLLTQSGSAQSVLVTYSRIWFRPDAFWILKDETRTRLEQIFPNGCCVKFAGDVYCGSKAESMDDHWNVMHALPGDGQHRPAVGSSMVSIQDRFNTLSNIEMETYEYGLPITYRDADTFDDEANPDQKSEPGAEVPVLLQPNADIRTKIMQLRADSVSPDMYKHSMDLMGPVAQFVTGSQPAIWGGGEPGVVNDTASGFSMQRDQAMGRIGIFYSKLKQFHADTATVACRDFAKNSDGEASMAVSSPSGDFESDMVDIAALEGEAKAYPEGDENFPVMWSQQRATWMQIMASPFGPPLVQEPDNADLSVRMMGIPDLVIPGADGRKKALKTIGELTAVSDGADVSVEMPPDSFIDPDIDDHAAEGATAKRWLNTPEGQKCKKENPIGWQNVKAYALAQLQLAPPPPPQPDKPLAPTLAAKFADLPPEAQMEVLKHWGINLPLQAFVPPPPVVPGIAGNGNPAPTLGANPAVRPGA